MGRRSGRRHATGISHFCRSGTGTLSKVIRIGHRAQLKSYREMPAAKPVVHVIGTGGSTPASASRTDFLDYTDRHYRSADDRARSLRRDVALGQFSALRRRPLGVAVDRARPAHQPDLQERARHRRVIAARRPRSRRRRSEPSCARRGPSSSPMRPLTALSNDAEVNLTRTACASQPARRAAGACAGRASGQIQAAACGQGLHLNRGSGTSVRRFASMPACPREPCHRVASPA